MVDEEREKVKIFLEAPPSQYEDLLSYAEYKRERFRDLADCVNREAVRGFIGAGNKAEPVVYAMCRVLEYIGIARSQMKEYVLFCVSACRQQAKRFFKAKEKGSHFYHPARRANWWPEPQETDFSQATEDPCNFDFVQRMSRDYKREEGNLFARFQEEEKEKGVVYLAERQKWF